MKRILILIALLIVLSPSTLFASFNKEMGVDQELIDQAILGKEMLFNRQYGQALKLFSRLEKEYSDSPTGKGGKMAVWQLKMFENEDFRFKSQYEKAAEDFNAFEVKRLRQGDVPVWDLFVFGAADGMMGFFRSRESKWLSALKKALHATRMLKQLKWKAPDFIDADMGFGSYEYWQSAMTQRIKILPFFKDNRQEGIRLLNEVVKKGVYAKDLARANLVFIYSNEKDYVRAAKVADELISKYPNNIIIRFLRAEIYFDTKDYDNALKLFQKIYAQDSGITRSLLFQGVIFYKQKKFDESKAILEKYVSLDKNKIWNAVGLYWLGRVAEKKKDIPLARHYYNASIKKDGFKPAKKEVKSSEVIYFHDPPTRKASEGIVVLASFVTRTTIDKNSWISLKFHICHPSMGITIVQKSDLKKKKKNPTTALILAGGAITGGSFKAGGVKALNDYMSNYSVNDFDVYLGISSGSLLVAPLAGGIKPEEILKSFDGTSERFSELSPWNFYWPNLKEMFYRPLSFWYSQLANLPRMAFSLFTSMPVMLMQFANLFQSIVRNPTPENYDALMKAVSNVVSDFSLPSILQLLPSGVFDNSSIERYLRLNIKKNRLTNNFLVTEKLTGKRLYISAMAVDSAKRVVFGPDENSEATISQAVQASTAMPGFYKPARINGVDYVDGGVQETANIDIAIEKGADLIICYNPFRPYDNKVLLEYIRKENKYTSKNRRLSDDGVMAVINQIFRAMFHSRLHVAIEQYKTDPNFKGDIILIEPKADDAAFFGLNPLVFGNRIKAAALGYESVRNSIDEHYPKIAKILNSYDIKISKKGVEDEISRFKDVKESREKLREVIEESSKPKTARKPKKKTTRRKKSN